MDLSGVRLRSRWDEISSSLWFRPAWITLLSILLAFVSTSIDSQVQPPDVLNAGAENARAILSAIASSTLTVTSLTFSLIMTALVLGSQQFSPRTLRTFMRDAASQNVLGIFIGTFMYSLLVLARVSSTDDFTFVPTFSIIVALLLALLSVAALIYFINHIAEKLQVNNLIAEVHGQTLDAMEEPLLEGVGIPFDETAHRQPPVLTDEEGAVVSAERGGYLQTIDPERLFRTARELDVTVRLERELGGFVPQGGVLLRVWPARRHSDDLDARLLESVRIDKVRTLFQDPRYGFRQLVDIALKALSPGINDPTTATNCVNYLTDLLVQMAGRDDPTPWRYDEAGMLRLVVPGVTFRDALDLAFTEIRLYSASDLATTLAMLSALAEIGRATTHPERRALVWREARIIVRGVDDELTEPYDRERVNRALCDVAAVVGESCEGVTLDRVG